MLKKNYKILDMFAGNPTRGYLLKEVKDYINTKSESYTYNSLNSFVKENVLIKEKKGGVCTYRIADSSKAISYLSMASEYKAWNSNNKIPIDCINELAKKSKTCFFVLLVTGSYAKGKQSSKSDLDVVLIVPGDVKKIIARLKQFCELNIPQIHLYVFTNTEFKQMLLDDKYNYGKEIAKNNLIFYGAEIYYKIMFEVMKNGFNY